MVVNIRDLLHHLYRGNSPFNVTSCSPPQVGTGREVRGNGKKYRHYRSIPPSLTAPPFHFYKAAYCRGTGPQMKQRWDSAVSSPLCLCERKT